MTKAKRSFSSGDPFRHRFRSFPQQLRSMKAPKFGVAIYRATDDSDTFASAFAETLHKWDDLNLSETYQNLSRCCHPIALNRGMVLHKREEIVQALEQVKDEDACQDALLDLWTALAHDLQGDFLLYVELFLSVWARATTAHSIDILRQAHTAVVSVLKTVQSHSDERSLADLFFASVRRSWPKLARAPPEIVARLANAFSHVFRRSKKKAELLKWTMEESGDLLQVVAQSALLSCVLPRPEVRDWAALVVPAFFEHLSDAGVVDVTKVCVEKLANDHEEHFDLFAGHLADTCRSEWKKKPSLYLTCLAEIASVRPFVNYDKTQSLLQWVAQDLLKEDVDFELVRRILSKLLSHQPPKSGSFRAVAASLVSDLLFDRGGAMEHLCTVISEGSGSPLWSQAVKARIAMNVAAEKTREEEILPMARVINFLSAKESWEDSLFDIPERSPDRLDSLPNRLLSRIIEAPDDELETLVECMVYLRPMSAALFDQVCGDLQKKLAKVSANFSDSHERIFLSLIRAMTKLICPAELSLNPTLSTVALKNLDSPIMAEIFRLFCRSSAASTRQFLAANDAVETVIDHLLSTDRGVRLNNLRSLCAIEENDVFSQMLKAESVDPNMSSYRERLRLLQNCLQTVKSSQNGIHRQAFFILLFSNFFEDFSLLWQPVVDLAAHAEAQLQDGAFWQSFEKVMVMSSKLAQNIADNVRSLLVRVALKLERLLSLDEQEFLFREFDGLVDGRYNAKSKRKLIQTFLGFFAKSCSDRRREILVAKATSLTRDSSEELQKASVEFLCVGVRDCAPFRDQLTNLCDKQAWKKQVRQLDQDFHTLMEKPRLRMILVSALVGLLKRTARAKAKEQGASRKIIIEGCATAGKDFLFDVIQEMSRDIIMNQSSRLSNTKAEVNAQMAIDLCLLAKSLLPPQNRKAVDELMTDLMVGICSNSDFTNAKDRKKALETMLKISKVGVGKDVFLAKDVLGKCILPLVDGAKKLPRKLAAVLSFWADSVHMFECFVEDIDGGGCLVDRLIAIEEEKSADGVVNVLSRLIRRMDENGEEKVLRQKLSQHFEKIAGLLGNWLTQKPLPLLHRTVEEDRLAAIVIISQNRVDLMKMAAGLAVNCRVLSRRAEKSWLGAICAIVTNAGANIPEAVFKCVTSLSAESREKLCVALIQTVRPGLVKADPLDIVVARLIDEGEDESRTEILLSLYAALALLIKNAATNQAQSLTLLLRLLERLRSRKLEEFYHVCRRHLLPHIRKFVRSKEEGIYTSAIVMLRFYLESADEEKRLPHSELKQLMNDDDEDADFFENVRHLQLHRRGRALRRLGTRIEAGEISFAPNTLNGILMPLAQRYLIQETYADQTELVDSALVFVSAVASKMKLDAYLGLVESLLKKEVEGKRMQRQKTEAISMVLRAFSFLPKDLEQASRERIKKFLLKLLSQLRAESTKSKSSLGLYVSVAKLSSLLGENSCVDLLLLDLCSRLKSRFFRDREEARVALVRIMEVFGQRFLPFLLGNLEAALQRGYQVHVRLSAASAVLSALKDTVSQEVVTVIVAKMISAVTLELFTDFSKEKKIAAILKKTPEAKKENGFTILGILAERSSKGDVGAILQPFLCPGTAVNNHENLKKRRRALEGLIRGLDANNNINVAEKLELAYGIIHGKLFGDNTDRLFAGLRLEFAFSLVLSTSRSSAMQLTSGQLAPFAVALTSAVGGKDVEAAAAALSLANHLLRQQETWRPEDPGALMDAALANLRRHSRNKQSKVLQQSYRLVDSLLRCVARAWTKPQIYGVRVQCLQALEDGEGGGAVVKHCASALSRLAPRDDELLEQLCKFYVTGGGGATAIESVAAILAAAAAKKSLVAVFMIENFGYEDALGRSRALSLLLRMFSSSTCARLLSSLHAQKLFLLCSHALVTEESSEVRRLAENLLNEIVKSKKCENEVNELSKSWASSESDTTKMLLASKLAVLIPESSLKLSIVLAKTMALTVFEKTGSDLGESVVKANLIECFGILLDKKNSKELAFIGKLTGALTDLILSPLELLREQLLPLVAKCIIQSSEKQFLKSWRDQEVLEKIRANVIELLRTCPSESLIQPLSVLCCHMSPPSCARLIAAFNTERREMNKKSFERRKIVLRVLMNVWSDVGPGWCRSRIVQLLNKCQDVVELQEEVRPLTKLATSTENLFPDKEDKNSKKKKRKIAATVYVSKKAKISA